MWWSGSQWPAQVPLEHLNPLPGTTDHCTRSKSPLSPEHASVFAHHSRYPAGGDIGESLPGSKPQAESITSTGVVHRKLRRGTRGATATAVPPGGCGLTSNGTTWSGSAGRVAPGPGSLKLRGGMTTYARRLGLFSA